MDHNQQRRGILLKVWKQTTQAENLLKIQTFEKHYRTQLTEGRSEFIKQKKESIESTDELLEMYISKIDIDIAI